MLPMEEYMEKYRRTHRNENVVAFNDYSFTTETIPKNENEKVKKVTYMLSYFYGGV